MKSVVLREAKLTASPLSSTMVVAVGAFTVPLGGGFVAFVSRGPSDSMGDESIE